MKFWTLWQESEGYFLSCCLPGQTRQELIDRFTLWNDGPPERFGYQVVQIDVSPSAKEAE